MPELPEVETVMRGLQQRLDGRVITRAVLNRADLRWPFPPGLARRLTGARVLGVSPAGEIHADAPRRRRQPADPSRHVGAHGAGTRRAPNQEPVLHEHMVLETDDGWRVGFVDPRRFGAVDLVATDAEDRHRLLAGLGPEPLDALFDGQRC